MACFKTPFWDERIMDCWECKIWRIEVYNAKYDKLYFKVMS